MFSESAELYDLIYSSFKDYETEAAQIAAFIESRHVTARSVLDVGCGTGEHARILSERFGYGVDGLDIEPDFVRIAQQKNPTGRFRQGDMTAFDIGRRYDIVLCLFSSIGYVRTLAGVRETLLNFRRHLAEEGLILVEPWLTPAGWKPGYVHMTTVERDDLKVCRMSHSAVEGTISKITFEYLIGRPDGISRTQEVHELGLFTIEQMVACFEDAGLTVRYEEPGFCGRGLYVASRVL